MSTTNGNTTSCDDVDRRNRIGSTGSSRALREACFGTLNWEITEEGELTIWGYDNFEVYEALEDGLSDYDGGIVTHEFLRKLANYLEPDEELDIQTAGFTKCRFPVLAKRYVVRDGKVLHVDLRSPEPIDQ